MKRKSLLWALGLVGVAALAAVYVARGYLPRLRHDRPRPGFLPAQLLASEQFSLAVWLPYPHQNLGLLRRALVAGGPPRPEESDEQDLPRALARLAGLPEPSLPAFGALEVPPATEIAFASDASGRRFALVAEVYPAAAAFAKLAGRLADNPWLAGGALNLDGRRVEVAWHGRVWSVTSPGFPDLASQPAAPVGGPPSLLIAEVRQAIPPLPSGRFHLTRQGDDLVLVSAGAPAGGLGLEGPELAEMGLFLLVVSGRRAAAAEPMQAMAFFSSQDPLPAARKGFAYDFPGVASICEAGGKRWTLPGEGVLKWSGRRVRRAEVGPWSIAALDGASLRRIRKLAPRLAPLVRPGPEGRLAWGLWLDLESGLAEVSRIAQALEEIPIASQRHRQRWRDAVTVLTPAARSFSRLSVVVTDEPGALHLWLAGRPAAD